MKWFPLLHSLTTYNKEDLRSDLSAGTVTGIMLIPQAMAYGILAGLDPIAGLYAAVFPLLIYALMGSSRHLAVGPAAIISILVFASVSEFATPGTENYAELVILLTLMVGILTLLLGVFRMGFIVNLMSHAVIKGFTIAAALIIGLSQVKNLSGISYDQSGNVISQLFEIIRHANQIHWITFAIGISSIISLIILKKIMPKLPYHIFVVAGITLMVFIFKLNDRGTDIVGELPSGMPSLVIPSFTLDHIMMLFPMAVTIAIIAFMESVAIGKTIAAKEKYKIDPNQELNAMGLSHIASAFSSALPIAGSFSRTAVNYQSGAKTQFSSIITIIFIILTLLFLTPLFYYLPKAVLAAIIIVALYSLFDYKGAIQLYRIKKADGISLFVTFAVTLLVSIEIGLLTGIIFSFVLFAWRNAHPKFDEMGYCEREQVFRNIERYPESIVFQGIRIIRPDMSLYFINMGFFDDKIMEILRDQKDLKWLIIDFSGVNDMDAMAVEHLEGWLEDAQHSQSQIIISGMKGPVRDLIKAAGWYEQYLAPNYYPSLQHAIDHIHEKQKYSCDMFYI